MFALLCQYKLTLIPARGMRKPWYYCICRNGMFIALIRYISISYIFLLIREEDKWKLTVL